MSTIKKFTSFTTSNCYVVVPNEKEDVCFVVDLPPDIEPALEYIKSKNLSVGGYLLTHGHYDHALGVPKVDGNIYINMDDEFLARNPQEQLSQFTNSELLIEEYKGLHKNPGHTKGSVSYEFQDLGVVFTGDFVFAEGIGRTDLFSGSNIEMKDSINRIFLSFDKNIHVFPGHGDSDTVSNILNYNDYLKEFIDD